eukprot:m.68069 g.68069  ORF g.68069 m.68069 type:complete len:101 (+) comp12187_c0_seq1:6422-6724(+)
MNVRTSVGVSASVDHTCERLKGKQRMVRTVPPGTTTTTTTRLKNQDMSQTLTLTFLRFCVSVRMSLCLNEKTGATGGTTHLARISFASADTFGWCHLPPR